jgi:uncharacterized membrane protein YraQ (UPF0718 family)
MVIRYVLAWLPMVLFAVLNGTLRQFTYGKAMSELHAHQLSSVTLILIFSAYVCILSAKWPLRSLNQAIAVGLIWVALTVLFESAMGRYLSNQSWEQMLQTYDILAGSLWPLVLVAVAVLPALVFWIRRAG